MKKYIHNNKEVDCIKPFIPQIKGKQYPKYYFKGKIGDTYYWFSEIDAEDIILTDENLNMLGRIIPQLREGELRHTIVKEFSGKWVRRPYRIIYNEE